MTKIDVDAMPPVKPAPKKAAPRQAMRDENDRDIRDPMRAPEGLVRQRRGHIDPFEIPEQVKGRYSAAGWSLEWKRFTVYGQQDISYENALAENHWEPVTSEEVPGFMPKGHTGAIIRDGLMLMRRPAYLTEEARRDDAQARLDLIRVKQEQLGQAPPGTLTRDHPGVQPKIGKSYERVEVPND